MSSFISFCLTGRNAGTPDLPTNIIPAKIAGLKLSGKFPMDTRIPPLRIKITLESNPLKSRILVGRLGARPASQVRPALWFAQPLFRLVLLRG